MKAHLAILVAGMLIVLPAAAGGPGLIFGSEELPELPDPADDVRYGPTYTGEQNHTYLDLQAAWFNYSAQSDEVILTMKTGNATSLLSPPPSYTIACTVNGTVAGNELRIEWRRWANQSTLRSQVMFVTKTGAGATIDNRLLKHEFEAELGDPGYFRFAIPRLDLLNLGERFEAPRGLCREYFDVTYGPTSFSAGFPGQPTNTDAAEANSVFSFREGKRLPGPGDPPLPIERAERENATAAPQTSKTPMDERTPFIAFGMAAASIVAVAIVRRRST